MFTGSASVLTEGRRALAQQLVERAVEGFESGAPARFNVLAAKAAYETALLLGREDLCDRLRSILSQVSWDQYLAGAIMSFAPVRTGKPISFPSLTEVEGRYPIFDPLYGERVMRCGQPHLEFCADRDYDAAFGVAQSPLEFEDIVACQALQGELDQAIASLDRLAEVGRRADVSMVIAIELVRRDRYPEAMQCLMRLEPLRDWTLVHLALGFCGRIPWTAYPFADY
jgi:hypothetical protein